MTSEPAPTSLLSQALEMLRRAGWTVEELEAPDPLPEEILARYPWLPDDLRKLLTHIGGASSPDQKVWLVTARIYRDGSPEFAWNECERLSLEYAETPDERAGIASFWDGYCPLFLSVRSGYAYLAIEKGTRRVVEGIEPEFEECTEFADSVLEALQRLEKPSPLTSDWS